MYSHQHQTQQVTHEHHTLIESLQSNITCGMLANKGYKLMVSPQCCSGQTFKLGGCLAMSRGAHRQPLVIAIIMSSQVHP